MKLFVFLVSIHLRNVNNKFTISAAFSEIRMDDYCTNLLVEEISNNPLFASVNTYK